VLRAACCVLRAACCVLRAGNARARALNTSDAEKPETDPPSSSTSASPRPDAGSTTSPSEAPSPSTAPCTGRPGAEDDNTKPAPATTNNEAAPHQNLPAHHGEDRCGTRVRAARHPAPGGHATGRGAYPPTGHGAGFAVVDANLGECTLAQHDVTTGVLTAGPVAQVDRLPQTAWVLRVPVQFAQVVRGGVFAVIEADADNSRTTGDIRLDRDTERRAPAAHAGAVAVAQLGFGVGEGEH
jgi:hypothetical protein